MENNTLPQKINTPLKTSFNPSDILLTPIQFVKGVGPHKSALLEKLDIKKIEDVLYHFPRSHQDRKIIPISLCMPGKKVSIKGTVLNIEIKQVGRQLGQAKAFIQDSSGIIEAVWFKRISYRYDVFASIKKDVSEGKKIFLFGLTDFLNDKLSLRVEEHEILDDNLSSPISSLPIVPVYPSTEGLSDKWIRQLAFQIKDHALKLPDSLPENLRSDQKLFPLSQAIQQFHFPSSWASRDQARERLAFDEFFYLELALAMNRQNREIHNKGFRSMPTKTLLTPFKNLLGYEFTKGQIKVINEIFKDMSRPSPMNRLLQGDVGSGKTVVALSAALLTIENKRQVTLLAPTEILASQHKLSLEKMIGNLPVRTALLTGSTPKSEAEKLRKKLSDGEIDLLIGTHAILENHVQFKELGLVIVDEQHRFGVRQREKLLDKSAKPGGLWGEKIYPDMLIMTATPIPRTLALTLYGDLDVSIIDEMPKGRVQIKTSFSTEQSTFQKIEKFLSQGQQAYIVVPLVEESEKLTKRSGTMIKAATKEFHKVQDHFSKYRVGLLHGQMNSEEKKKVMNEFRSGKVNILVATPVIEVGIDVPNATIIAIMNPERFGLSQLHQLRGRVGRGSLPSECLMVVEEILEQTSERLQIFAQTSDGFRLSEEDLKLRGPGEFLGEQQHGVPLFKVGDLIHDGLLIARAKEIAKRLVHGEFSLTMKEFNILNKELKRRFGDKIHLSHVG